MYEELHEDRKKAFLKILPDEYLTVVKMFNVAIR
jgi:hypothetical protein